MKSNIDLTYVAAAQQVIDELLRTDNGAETLHDYQQHRDGDTDFVFVEEGVSAKLAGRRGARDNDGGHEFTCGLVFAWLKEHHGVNPPAWYVHYLTSPSTCECGNIPAHTR